MSTLTLDAIREAAEAKYGSLDIEVGDKTVRLLNPLRLAKPKRDELMKLQDGMKDEGVDQEKVMRDMIRLAADTKTNGDLLIKAVGDDLAVMAELLAEYAKRTRVGEASA